MITPNTRIRVSTFPDYFSLTACDIMTSADLVGAAGEHGLADPDALARPHHAQGMRAVHT